MHDPVHSYCADHGRAPKVSHQGQPSKFDFKFEPLSAELLWGSGAEASAQIHAS